MTFNVSGNLHPKRLPTVKRRPCCDIVGQENLEKNVSRNQIKWNQMTAMSKEEIINSEVALAHFKIGKNHEKDEGGDIRASLRLARLREKKKKKN